MTAFQKKQMRLSDPGCLKTSPEPSVLMRWTRRLPSGDTDGRQPDVWRYIMEIDISRHRSRESGLRATCKSLEFLSHSRMYGLMKPVVPSTVPYSDMRSRQQLGVKLWGQRSRRISGRQAARQGGICQHEGGEEQGMSGYDQRM